MSSPGINVPEAPECVRQEYQDSVVVEHFKEFRAREDRVSQLKALGRRPLVYFSHVNKHGDLGTYAVRWIEPRGGAS